MPLIYLLLFTIKELKSGIYRLLNTVKGGPMTAAQLIDGVNTNGEHLEKRLLTMMQSVCGTNQYWYLRSEVHDRGVWIDYFLSYI